jgi:hypothetical protein
LQAQFGYGIVFISISASAHSWISQSIWQLAAISSPLAKAPPDDFSSAFTQRISWP